MASRGVGNGEPVFAEQGLERGFQEANERAIEIFVNRWILSIKFFLDPRCRRRLACDKSR
jgi:hypothetical protein